MENKELTYDAAVGELEKIVAQMQSDKCSIDNLSALTSRALKLLEFCKTRLKATDEEVKKLLETIE